MVVSLALSICLPVVLFYVLLFSDWALCLTLQLPSSFNCWAWLFRISKKCREKGRADAKRSTSTHVSLPLQLLQFRLRVTLLLSNLPHHKHLLIFLPFGGYSPSPFL